MAFKPVGLYQLPTDQMMRFIAWLAVWLAEADKLDAQINRPRGHNDRGPVIQKF